MTATLSRTELEELKNRVDLVELFRSCGLELKKKGRNWLCRCPFHADATASLSINPARQLWNCFGCEAGGDAIRFLQLRENLDFEGALERLRGLAGELPAAPAAVPPSKLPGQFQRGELLERVAELYRKRFLESESGPEYLRSRGLDSPELWQAFRVGLCDGSLRAGLPPDGELIEALQTVGVLGADGKEHFRGCVVVPLTHPDRGVVGLYGRRIRPDAENRHLYLPGAQEGVLHWQALKASPEVVVAESVLDALSFWQAGVREVTCLFGTQNLPQALPELLQRFGVHQVRWALDGDAAGEKAAARWTPRLEELGVRVQRLQLPEGHDPNSLLVSQGAQALQQLQLVAETRREEEPALADEQGFTLRLGAVGYRVEMIAPFSNRLRANLGAQHDSGAWAQDRLDFFLHRDRAKLAKQLVASLRISRLEAENQVGALLRQAQSWVREHRSEEAATPDAPAPMSERQRAEALHWLRQPQLAQSLLEDMQNLGYIGEERAKLLAYLIGVSRKLPKPLSGIILSQSGCGKSTLTDVLEQLTPPEEVLMFTRITAQALQYMAQSMLRGKLILVEERAGAESAEYSIRILQSRQKLVQAVPQKDPATGKIATQILVVEGPVAYLETTTDPKINHENATRCFEITLDESVEQTERILASQRQRRLPTRQNWQREIEAIRERHHCAQRLLEPVLVFIPYADRLTFPSKKLRNRRDHERFLCLIEASAFLHQHQRERGQTEEGDPFILAALEDYAIAYDLAQEVLAITLHELSRGAQDVWQKVRDWVWAQAAEQHGEFLFTRRDLRLLTGTEDHQLRAALQELVEMEYLEIVSGNGGRAYQYRLLVLRQEDAPVTLLHPDELRRILS